MGAMSRTHAAAATTTCDSAAATGAGVHRLARTRWRYGRSIVTAVDPRATSAAAVTVTAVQFAVCHVASPAVSAGSAARHALRGLASASPLRTAASLDVTEHIEASQPTSDTIAGPKRDTEAAAAVIALAQPAFDPLSSFLATTQVTCFGPVATQSRSFCGGGAHSAPCALLGPFTQRRLTCAFWFWGPST